MWVALIAGVSLVDFDEEAWLFTREEARVFGVADHLKDS